MFDFDLDGDLDIYVACGHIMDDPTVSGGLGPKQPDLLFANLGDGTFENISPAAGPWFRERRIGRGAAFCDFDEDGDTDIFVVNKCDEGVLLENRSPRGHFVRLRLVGTRSNRDGFGARILARAGAKTRIFEARSGRSYASACDPRVVIGLGDAERIDELRIRWPSGVIQTLADVAADRTIRIIEPRDGRAR